MVFGKSQPQPQSYVYVAQRGYGKDAKDTRYTSLPTLMEGEKLEGVINISKLQYMLKKKGNGKALHLSRLTITRFSSKGVRLLYG
jgi:hypothetical protein